jgi:hypothetical protein
MMFQLKMMSNQGQPFCPVPLSPMRHFPLDDLSIGQTRRHDDRQLGQYETPGCPVPVLPCCRAALYRFFT